MVKLSQVIAGEGLSIDEMVQVARRINPQSWVKYDFLRDEYPYEVRTRGLLWYERDEFWFGYDYQAQEQDMNVYLSNNSGYSWNSQIGLRIVKGNLTLGFTGRIKEVHCPKILLDLCSYVENGVEASRKSAEDKRRERQKIEIERLKGTFIGSNI